MTSRVRSRAFLVVLFGMVVGIKSAQPAQMYEVAGEVLEMGNTPIEKVLVRAWRGNREVGRDVTKNGGKYSIKLSGGPTIDIVTYDHSDFNVGKVADLSGERDQSIKKVLYKRGAAVSQLQGLEVLAALEAILQLELANGVSGAALATKYGEMFRELKVLQAERAPRFDERYREVGQRYHLWGV